MGKNTNHLASFDRVIARMRKAMEESDDDYQDLLIALEKLLHIADRHIDPNRLNGDDFAFCQDVFAKANAALTKAQS